MTSSEHWEQFSAYRPMIEDARRRERKRILEILSEEEQVGEAILKKEDCNADCYKCDISGHTTIKTIKRLRERIENG